MKFTREVFEIIYTFLCFLLNNNSVHILYPI